MTSASQTFSYDTHPIKHDRGNLVKVISIDNPGCQQWLAEIYNSHHPQITESFNPTGVKIELPYEDSLPTLEDGLLGLPVVVHLRRTSNFLSTPTHRQIRQDKTRQNEASERAISTSERHGSGSNDKGNLGTFPHSS